METVARSSNPTRGASLLFLNLIDSKVPELHWHRRWLMSKIRSWQFWRRVVVVALIPLIGIVLNNTLQTASSVKILEKQLAVQQAESQLNFLNTQLNALSGALLELYVRLGPDRLPEAYQEAVQLAHSARLNLISRSVDEASKNIASAYEKVYSIPLPVGHPLLHEKPIGRKTDL